MSSTLDLKAQHFLLWIRQNNIPSFFFQKQIFPNFGENVANVLATFECVHIACSLTLIFHCKSLFFSMFDVEDVNNTKYWYTHTIGYASKKSVTCICWDHDGLWEHSWMMSNAQRDLYTHMKDTISKKNHLHVILEAT